MMSLLLFSLFCRRVFSIVLEIQYPSAAAAAEEDGSTTRASILQYSRLLAAGVEGDPKYFATATRVSLLKSKGL